ncbi:MAG TPA: metal ABC transporter permease [Myxococcota bacterium]|nr:metal ABC transporter permease [Myxococcota bacterium]HQK51529.1 metal ABC transporter permease [Myxococcota bacterium]
MDDPASLSQFFEAWDLFRDPVVAGTVTGAVLGWMGVSVVLGRMVFLSAALSQAAGLGVVTAFWVGGMLGMALSPWGGALACTGLAALLLAGRDRGLLGREVRLALVYLVGAAGTLVIGSRVVGEIQDVQTLLFGSAVAVRPEDLKVLVLVLGPLWLFQVWWGRGLRLALFRPEAAAVRGLPVRWLQVFTLISLTLSLSLATRVIGALPVFAFSVLPATAAIALAPSVAWAQWVALGAGALSGFLGYLLAFLWSLPVGPAQALVAAGLALLAWGLRRLVLRW